MRFRLFPSDLEGVGSYRVLYPYGCMEAYGGHDCMMEFDPRSTSPSGSFKFPEPTGPIPSWFDSDVYVFQRRLERAFLRPSGMRTPWGVPEMIRWLQSHGKVVVVENDDWMSGLPQGHPAMKALDQYPWLSLKVLDETMRLADIVTVSTQALAEAYGRPDAHVLPNLLEWSWWKDIDPVYDRDRRLRIGWMGSLKYRGSDLACLRGIIGPWLERHPNVDFVSAGGVEPHDYLGIPADRRVTEPYSKFPGHIDTTQAIDIGLVPLEYTRFNECKSALKGLEYAACGIPCVATPTESYREWVDSGVNGMLAKRPKDWARCLDELVEGDAWRTMGRAARVKAQAHTIQEHWTRWEEVFDARSGSDADARPAGLHAPLLQAA